MDARLRVAVLLSAGGTTLQNLLDKVAAGQLAVDLVLVASNNADAFGLERARRAGIATLAVPRRDPHFSERVFDGCRAAGAELVCLAGFLQLIHIPDDFAGRVMNIHPSLIPAFCGKGMYGHHVHEAVLAYGAKISGCTVHFADNEYDRGPIILQRCVPVFDSDTPDTLEARVFDEECIAYPQAIQLFADGKLRLDGRRVRVG